MADHLIVVLGDVASAPVLGNLSALPASSNVAVKMARAGLERCRRAVLS